jgi:hypothetical protein
VPEPEFPGLKKEHGEGEEQWALKDESGTSLLKLRFVLKETRTTSLTFMGSMMVGTSR